MAPKVIHEFNGERWVGDTIMRQAAVDVRRLEERLIEEEIIRLARQHGLIPEWDLIDVCFHNWYDMENPSHTDYLYGQPPEEVAKFTPARWRLRSVWHVRKRAVERQRALIA